MDTLKLSMNQPTDTLGSDTPITSLLDTAKLQALAGEDDKRTQHVITLLEMLPEQRGDEAMLALVTAGWTPGEKSVALFFANKYETLYGPVKLETAVSQGTDEVETVSATSERSPRSRPQRLLGSHVVTKELGVRGDPVIRLRKLMAKLGYDIDVKDTSLEGVREMLAKVSQLCLDVRQSRLDEEQMRRLQTERSVFLAHVNMRNTKNVLQEQGVINVSHPANYVHSMISKIIQLRLTSEDLAKLLDEDNGIVAVHESAINPKLHSPTGTKSQSASRPKVKQARRSVSLAKPDETLIFPFVDRNESDSNWQERALCAKTDPEAFFPEKGGSTREAKKICLSCGVRGECLNYALANEERFGVWGGLSERERRRLKKRVA